MYGTKDKNKKEVIEKTRNDTKGMCLKQWLKMAISKYFFNNAEKIQEKACKAVQNNLVERKLKMLKPREKNRYE